MTSDSATAQQPGPAIPIAQIQPGAQDSATRAVHGVITIVWPYNKLKNSIAFILAEPEFRLRLSKGQVRVNFIGPSAKAISECGLGSGDQVQLSLEGAEYLPNDATIGRLPGAELEWQLRFSGRMYLQATLGEQGTTKILDVDQPHEVEPAPGSGPDVSIEPTPQARLPSPDFVSSLPVPLSSTPSKNALLRKLTDGEFESPAFVKRARISYGSLFEDDIFEEDGAVKGKGRKRTRFSTSAWRYSSRSPSPEPVTSQIDSIPDNPIESPEDGKPPLPQMTDEGCQTMDFDIGSMSLPNASAQGSDVLVPPIELEVVPDVNPFIRNDGFIDQGHRTFAPNDWTTPVPALSQPVFGSSILFNSTEGQIAPFPAVLESLPDQKPDSWDVRLTHDGSVPYPELPLETGQNNDESMTDLSQPAIDYPELIPGDTGPSEAHYSTQTQFEAPAAPLGDPVPVNTLANFQEATLHRTVSHTDASLWSAINKTSTAALASPPPPAARSGSTDGQTPDSALIVDESESDDEAAERQGSEPGSDMESASSSIPPTGTHDVMVQGSGDPESPTAAYADIGDAEFEEEARAYASESGGESDEEGGDYDTRNYLRPEDDEDDSHDEDLGPHHLEPEFDDGGAGSWDDDEEQGEEDEEDEEYESEYEMDVDVYRPPLQSSHRPPVQSSSAGPVVIDLLSSSDEEEDDDNPPPPRPTTNSFPASGPMSTSSKQPPSSPNYAPESMAEENSDEEYESESEEESAAEHGEVQLEGASERDRSEQEEHAQKVKDAPAKDEEAVTNKHSPVAKVVAEEDKEPEELLSAPQVQVDPMTVNDDTIEHSVSSQVEVTVDSELLGIQVKPSAAASERVTDHVAPFAEDEGDASSQLQVEVEPSEVVLEGRIAEPQMQTDGPTNPSPSPASASMLLRDKEQDEDVKMADATSLLEFQASSVQSPGPLAAQPEEIQETATLIQMNVEVEENEDQVMENSELSVNAPAEPLDAVVEEIREQITGATPGEGHDEHTAFAHNIIALELETTETVQIPTEAQSIEEPLVVQTTSFQSQVYGGEDALDAALADSGSSKPIEGPSQGVEQETKDDDAASFSSQVDGDDALQAALREENSAQPSSPEVEIEDNALQEPPDVQAPPEDQMTVSASINTPSQKEPTSAKSPQGSPPHGEPTPVKAQSHPDANFTERQSSPANQNQEVAEDDSHLDDSVVLARATIASRRSNRRRDATPEMTRPHTRSQKTPEPEPEAVGDDSIQLAKSSLHTPSKLDHVLEVGKSFTGSSPASSRIEEETGSLAACKLKLNRHLRDELPDYTSLKVLRHHMGKSVDVLAVAMMTPEDPRRAKGGPREYMMSFTVTDHSVGTGVAEVQLYRPHKESLPRVRAGDPVLLRNFTVLSLKGKGFGLRTNDGSSWAVYDRPAEEPPQIKGPPLECGEGEAQFAAYLREWMELLDDKARQKLEKANQKIIEAGKAGK
ncbi:hypothetical protein BX600DRAFT_463431 [Xylariales sp. PMI_506]|nr:hypothetical protein BX600DRAFT_463431 [Xylariales sp. PMI_506]